MTNSDMDLFADLIRYELDLKQIKDVINKVLEIRDNEEWSYQDLASVYEDALFEIKEIVENLLSKD